MLRLIRPALYGYAFAIFLRSDPMHQSLRDASDGLAESFSALNGAEFLTYCLVMALATFPGLWLINRHCQSMERNNCAEPTGKTI